MSTARQSPSSFRRLPTGSVEIGRTVCRGDFAVSCVAKISDYSEGCGKKLSCIVTGTRYVPKPMGASSSFVKAEFWDRDTWLTAVKSGQPVPAPLFVVED